MLGCAQGGLVLLFMLMSLNIPELDKACPRRGNVMTGAIGRFLLRLLGWKIVGNFPPEPRFVIAWGPHTSYWDWYVGVACLLAFRIRSSWMVADGFFWWPLSSFMTALGGVPIKRDRSHHVVAQTVEKFKNSNQFVLAISPEGNRKKVKKWKTGFYHIAREAKVPIFLVSLDYASKTLTLGPIFRTTGDVESDLNEVQSWFRKFTARYPEQA